VGIAGRVGDDDLGQYAQKFLSRAGVESSALRVEPGHQTSATQVVNVQGEDRRFIHATGANDLVDGSEVDLERLARAKVLYCGGFLLSKAWTGPKLASLLAQARELGVTTVVDVVLPGERDFRAELAPALPYTDYFLPNSDEGRVLTGMTDPAAQANWYRELGAKTAIVTCGGEGAILVGPAGTMHQAPFPMDYLDGTGSGDAFAAGFIRGLLMGLETRACLRMGAALGASAVRAAGATTGVFRGDELDAFLAQAS
jgi:sugar/nucleoside kinase (ribokinase family)